MSLSYQHIYHAGNPADIHKHLWLLSVLQHLKKQKKPLFFMDTHGGRGLYDLQSPEALKTKDAHAGIQKIASLSIKHSLWKSYQHLLSKSHKDGIKLHPGSPFLAALTLDKSDEIICFELHKNEFWHLRKNMRRFKNARIEKQDMQTAMLPALPKDHRSGCVLIDPSYEIKSEYEEIPLLTLEAMRQYPKGCFLLWYPILPAGRHEILKEKFTALKDHFVIDEWIYGDSKQRGMYGSGIIAVNISETIQNEMKQIKELLLPRFMKK